MTYFEALIIAIIEGLTEFLPISSTGHMMLGTAILGIEPTPFVKLFTIAIQLGAILSVIVLYFKRFFKSVNFYLKLIVAFIPAAIAGILLGDYIDAALENLWGVAVALLLGGIVLLFADQWFNKEEVHKEEDISLLPRLKLAFANVLLCFRV